MRVVSNKNRTALHNERLPDGPLTPRQRAMADAVRLCGTLSDFAIAPKQATTAITVCKIDHRANKASAEAQVRDGLAAARASLAVAEWLDRQDTSTLAADHAEYLAELEGDADATPGSMRFAALESAAYKIGVDAAKQGWLCPGADIAFNISIIPTVSP